MIYVLISDYLSHYIENTHQNYPSLDQVLNGLGAQDVWGWALKRTTILFLTIIISISWFPKASFALDGNTPGTAFTAIGMARGVNPKNRYAWFNIQGNIFKSYIKGDGSVLILRDYGDGAGALPTNSSWDDTQGRFILPPAALAAMDGLTKVGYTHGPTSSINAVTSNVGIVARVKANLPLHQGKMDNVINSDWIGTNSNALTVNTTCNSPTTPKTLANLIVHTCGSQTGTVLIPKSGFQRVTWSAGEISSSEYIEVSVSATPVSIPTAAASLSVTKIASPDTNVTVGQVVTYTYQVENTGGELITNISLADVHNGYGSAPIPDMENATLNDIGVSGDSYNPDGANNAWDTLGPDDKLTVTASYTVTQADIDQLQ